MLPETPTGTGRPITDRAFWDPLYNEPAFREIIAQAEQDLATPLPEQSDDLYLEYTRTGNRTRWQEVAAVRRSRPNHLVFAECAENQGRFLRAIEELVLALCAERTWVFPAHDSTLEDFHGTTINIDIASSALGWNLSTIDYLLGDRLSPEARREIREKVRDRVLDPFLDMISGKREENWWLSTTNNWNAVCLAGVAGAALAQVESREERARFVAAAVEYSRNFLAGFTPDGYCSEGLSYWNYGFGFFVMLAEVLRQGTDGEVDLMQLPESRMPASFGARIQVSNGFSPAFADCDVFTRPSAALMHYVNRRFGLGVPGYETFERKPTLHMLFEGMLYDGAESAPIIPPPPGATPEGNLRSWFDQAGILIGRPDPAVSAVSRLGVALKGGHNAEHHNHNDVGTFVVFLGDRPVLLDPGWEIYAERTFSSRRYDSNLLNSYGHPVPVIDGKLQDQGREAEGLVVHTDFRPEEDTLALELSRAYPTPQLKGLERTFVYSRRGMGALTVTDRIELTEPATFATALLTLGSWQSQEDGGLLVRDQDAAVLVRIDTGGRAYTVEAEEIREDAPVAPTRLGIRLLEPLPAGTSAVTLTITPME